MQQPCDVCLDFCEPQPEDVLPALALIPLAIVVDAALGSITGLQDHTLQ